MPKLIPESRIKEFIANSSIIKNGKPENAEGIKYDFRISSRILKAKYHQPIDINNLPEQEKANIFIEPGEVVFVLTEEILDLPKNIKAILMPKRKMSHDGIITLGGLSIDPLYKGRLLIGLYNFSSSAFPLMPGKKLIAVQFYELGLDEQDEFTKPETEINDFPDDLVRLMSKYNPVSVSSLIEATKNIELKFDQIRKEFRDNNDWFKQFQKSLEGHDKSIDKILSTMEKEVDDRKSKQIELEKSIQTYAEKAYRTAAIVGTLGALIISLIIFLIEKSLAK